MLQAGNNAGAAGGQNPGAAAVNNPGAGAPGQQQQPPPQHQQQQLLQQQQAAQQQPQQQQQAAQQPLPQPQQAAQQQLPQQQQAAQQQPAPQQQQQAPVPPPQPGQAPQQGGVGQLHAAIAAAQQQAPQQQQAVLAAVAQQHAAVQQQQQLQAQQQAAALQQQQQLQAQQQAAALQQQQQWQAHQQAAWLQQAAQAQQQQIAALQQLPHHNVGQQQQGQQPQAQQQQPMQAPHPGGIQQQALLQQQPLLGPQQMWMQQVMPQPPPPQQWHQPQGQPQPQQQLQPQPQQLPQQQQAGPQQQQLQQPQGQQAPQPQLPLNPVVAQQQQAPGGGAQQQPPQQMGGPQGGQGGFLQGPMGQLPMGLVPPAAPFGLPLGQPAFQQQQGQPNVFQGGRPMHGGQQQQWQQQVWQGNLAAPMMMPVQAPQQEQLQLSLSGSKKGQLEDRLRGVKQQVTDYGRQVQQLHLLRRGPTVGFQDILMIDAQLATLTNDITYYHGQMVALQHEINKVDKVTMTMTNSLQAPECSREVNRRLRAQGDPMALTDQQIDAILPDYLYVAKVARANQTGAKIDYYEMFNRLFSYGRTRQFTHEHYRESLKFIFQGDDAQQLRLFGDWNLQRVTSYYLSKQPVTLTPALAEARLTLFKRGTRESIQSCMTRYSMYYSIASTQNAQGEEIATDTHLTMVLKNLVGPKTRAAISTWKMQQTQLYGNAISYPQMLAMAMGQEEANQEYSTTKGVMFQSSLLEEHLPRNGGDQQPYQQRQRQPQQQYQQRERAQPVINHIDLASVPLMDYGAAPEAEPYYLEPREVPQMQGQVDEGFDESNSYFVYDQFGPEMHNIAPEVQQQHRQHAPNQWQRRQQNQQQQNAGAFQQGQRQPQQGMQQQVPRQQQQQAPVQQQQQQPAPAQQQQGSTRYVPPKPLPPSLDKNSHLYTGQQQQQRQWQGQQQGARPQTPTGWRPQSPGGQGQRQGQSPFRPGGGGGNAWMRFPRSRSNSPMKQDPNAPGYDPRRNPWNQVVKAGDHVHPQYDFDSPMQACTKCGYIQAADGTQKYLKTHSDAACDLYRSFSQIPCDSCTTMGITGHHFRRNCKMSEPGGLVRTPRQPQQQQPSN
jgi:hypothetical protein